MKKQEQQQPQSKVDVTLGRIMQLALKLGVGAKIPAQDVLAKKLNCSRTVLREALSTLEYLKIIDVRPKLGTTVNDPDKWQTRNQDVIEWRAQISGNK